MTETTLYCTRCWLEQIRRRPLAPCRRCSGLTFEPRVDIARRNRVLELAWPLGITESDRAFLRSIKLSADEAPAKKKKEKSC